MNTRSLRVFVEVARTGSFSIAARNLGLTQPAVSSQIRSLEKEFGSILIDRSKGHSQLTEAGRSLLKHARAILEKEEELRLVMDSKRHEVGGPLAVAASNIPGEYILPGLLARFRALHPLAEPTLSIGDSGGVLESVRSGEVDVGCVGFGEDDERLSYGLLCEDRLVLIAPPGHPLARKRSLKLGDLEGETFLWREEGSGTGLHMRRILGDLGLDKGYDASMRLGGTMAVIQAVAAGAGLSVTSLWAAEAYIRLGRLALLEFKGFDHRREFHHVRLKRRPTTRAASALLELLEEERPALDARLRSLST